MSNIGEGGGVVKDPTSGQNGDLEQSHLKEVQNSRFSKASKWMIKFSKSIHCAFFEKLKARGKVFIPW